jgi:predicted nucleic acid-binding protein
MGKVVSIFGAPASDLPNRKARWSAKRFASSARAGRLGEEDRRTMLRAIDALLARRSDRPAGAVDRELAQARAAGSAVAGGRGDPPRYVGAHRCAHRSTPLPAGPQADYADGIRLGLSSIVLYEWRRGPRTEQELAIEQLLFGPDVMVGFGEAEARKAAELCRRLKRPRGRELDLAIAACAVEHGASLWTLNVGDFNDIPELVLHRP